MDTDSVAGMAMELDTMNRYAQGVLVKEAIVCTELTEASGPERDLLIANVEFEDCTFVVTYFWDRIEEEKPATISIVSRRFPQLSVEIPSSGAFSIRKLAPDTVSWT
tara:strand:- start:3630 stop:3950 length:321 start_codon:yes stop_codon:yes gene_type:complete